MVYNGITLTTRIGSYFEWIPHTNTSSTWSCILHVVHSCQTCQKTVFFFNPHIHYNNFGSLEESSRSDEEGSEYEASTDSNEEDKVTLTDEQTQEYNQLVAKGR